MLVISRRPGEAVVIADGLLVKVLGVQGSRVKLGFEGSDQVVREEIWAEVQRQKENTVPDVSTSP